MFCKLVVCFLLISCTTASKNSEHCDDSIRYLGEENWQVILKGKWVVKFYANWCPACKSFKAEWEELAKEFYRDGFCTASADVSTNADLSGRFFVTSLPTFYMINNGEIRMYNGGRSKEGLKKFVLEGTWMDTPVVPWYISPTSYHMATLGTFFKFSMALRNFHTHITENWGVPAWVSYIAFAILTILVGFLFGLFVVFLCDIGFGPASGDRRKKDDPFGVEANIGDVEEDVVDEDNVEFMGEDSEEGEEEVNEDEDNDEEEGGQAGELEADDEGDEAEKKREEGSGEPRKRRKVRAEGDVAINAEVDDEEEEEEEEDTKKK